MEHENRDKADTGAAIEKRLSLEKRLGEVEKVIAKLYEDYALGKAGADEIDLLLPKYRKEQGELKGQLALFREESNEQKETAQNAEKWGALIRQYNGLQELTAMTDTDTIRLQSSKKEVSVFMGAIGTWHMNNIDDTLQMLKSLQVNVAGGIKLAKLLRESCLEEIRIVKVIF